MSGANKRKQIPPLNTPMGHIFENILMRFSSRLLLQWLPTMPGKLRLSQSKYVSVLEFYRIAITPTNLFDTQLLHVVWWQTTNCSYGSSCILSYRGLPIREFCGFFSLFLWSQHPQIRHFTPCFRVEKILRHWRTLFGIKVRISIDVYMILKDWKMFLSRFSNPSLKSSKIAIIN